MGLLLAFSTTPAALYGGCLLFGLSVGNIITFPALIVQREFPAAAFGLVVGLSTAISQLTFSLAPAVFGFVRDRTGSYDAVLAICIALQLGAAALVILRKGKPATKRALA